MYAYSCILPICLFLTLPYEWLLNEVVYQDHLHIIKLLVCSKSFRDHLNTGYIQEAQAFSMISEAIITIPFGTKTVGITGYSQFFSEIMIVIC